MHGCSMAAVDGGRGAHDVALSARLVRAWRGVSEAQLSAEKGPGPARPKLGLCDAIMRGARSTGPRWRATRAAEMPRMGTQKQRLAKYPSHAFAVVLLVLPGSSWL